MITLALTDGVGPALSGFEAHAKSRLGSQIDGLGQSLLSRVRDNLGGAVLARRSGRLAAAQQVRITAAVDAVSVAVGFDPAEVPYGAIQEFGGTTRAHLIAAKGVFALAFTVGDRLVFAKRVRHPGSRIPEHSFLRSALAGFAPDARGAVADTMNEALHA